VLQTQYVEFVFIFVFQMKEMLCKRKLLQNGSTNIYWR